jgi:hypothetical protein
VISIFIRIQCAYTKYWSAIHNRNYRKKSSTT